MRLERRDQLAEVVLTGPGKGNAMGPDLWRELPQLFGLLCRDEKVRVVVLRGEGKHFTYGLDLPAMMKDLAPTLSGGTAKNRTALHDLVLTLQGAIGSVEACRKPVVAAISGWCIGGGLDLAAACDVRLCSADARFSLREAKVAMVADLGSLQRLPRIIGEGHARELALAAKDIDAQRALRIGLVNDVFDTPEALLEGARLLASEIAQNPPIVVQGVKRVMNECRDLTVSEGLKYVAAWNAAFLPSRDLGEAMTAFLEKRAPKFVGE
ncbi:MAG: crotonase/enoyl-CoA hydratase family protein [Deltaproteobacteria bacterium]|nr:crotonase/enoyl-CoA hydratase family protein [Deltaproteobacteria bacterium]